MSVRAAAAWLAATAAGLLCLSCATGTCRVRKKGPGGPPGLLPRSVGGLLQRRADRAELGVQRGAEVVDDGDDGQRDAGGDPAVFDGGGAGLILHETRNQILLKLNSMYTWLLELVPGLAGVLSTVTMRNPRI